VSPPAFDLSCRDAVEWLQQLPSDSVDLLVTDPAYESLEKHRAIGTTTRLKHSKSSSNDWFGIFPNARFSDLFAEVFRVLRHNSHFYLFCDAETMFVAKPEAERAGFRFWKPLVWDKRTIGMGYHYRARYEFILFFEKGKVFSRSINLGANSITQDFANESKLKYDVAEKIKIEEGFVSLGGAYEEPLVPYLEPLPAPQPAPEPLPQPSSAGKLHISRPNY